MKKKKWLIGVIIAIVIALIGVLYFILNNKDEDTTLTLLEKKWIENNKNNIIDFGVLNNIAILNNEGDGLFFDFLDSLEQTTGLDFNKKSYEYGTEVSNEYSFKVTENIGKNDILVYTDNYVILSKNNIKYNRLKDINNLTLGVSNENIEEVNTYLDNGNILFKSFKTTDELITEINKENSSINAIVLPKLIFLSKDFDSKLYINYNITEMKDNYVISLGKNDRLNNIIEKYYKKWKKEEYDASYSKHFTSTYFSKHEVDEQSKAKFRSKRYIYGFVSNFPFDKAIERNLLGTNSSIISNFSKLSNVEISYKEYGNYSKLLNAFNTNKIDFYFDMYTDSNDYKIDVYKTVSAYDEQIVITSNINNNVTINSTSSLKGEKIAVLNNTKVLEFFKKIGADIVACDSINELLTANKDNTLIALDLLTYNYYSNDTLKNNKIDYQFSLDSEYDYVIRDIKENEIFMSFLDFYLSFTNEKELINTGYYNTITKNTNLVLLKNVLIALAILTGLGLVYIIIKKIKPNKKNIMKKEDKIRYIDMLTSLKNRNYLNDSIEIWDESEVYPQTIIVVDLNNIAYVNDNYGHQEGDNVIKEASNILIKGQMENSDIIRTNGNEFLIYLVGYDEKQIVSYIRKLNKDFKELSYGFGAAIGYSMITDAIKTIDDAINEATLDMRNNKEELNN